LLVACGNAGAIAPRPAKHEQGCPSELGDQALYVPPTDTLVSAPQRCPTSRPGEAYIRITGPGALPFSVDPPGKATGCTTPGATCATIDLGSFLDAVTRELKARGIRYPAWGLGQCARGGNRGQDWDTHHFGIIIYRWREANTAVSVVAEQLRTWNASQSFEVSVEEMACVVGAARPAMGERWACSRGGACELVADPDPMRCGDVTCGDGQECCNASCSTCAPRGGVCFQDECQRGVLR
jgi:hypothetical protein